MKATTKKTWDFFNGRKTWIGVLLAVIYSGLVAQGIISRNEALEWLIMAVTGVGVGHKIVKS